MAAPVGVSCVYKGMMGGSDTRLRPGMPNCRLIQSSVDVARDKRHFGATILLVRRTPTQFLAGTAHGLFAAYVSTFPGQ
jgi:hypothetical protein